MYRRPITERNLKQAEVPDICETLFNARGTAPGMWFEKNGKIIISLPGVPHEMKLMMSDLIIPKLKQTFKTPTILHKVIRTIGIGESFLAEKISEWEKTLPNHIKLAYLPGLGEVKLRLTGIGDSIDSLRQETHFLTSKLEQLVGDYIYGYGEEPLEFVLAKTLTEKNLSISVAESCTGGYLSHLITRVPGSSAFFEGSIIPYSYEIKMDQLGVSPETLAKFGAVSDETIREMAEKVREKFKTDIGVATSGIAGPGGATPDKPVGTVWIAYSDNRQTISKKLLLSKDRLINIQMASLAVLNLVRSNHLIR